jgi:hypothetical protein
VRARFPTLAAAYGALLAYLDGTASPDAGGATRPDLSSRATVSARDVEPAPPQFRDRPEVNLAWLYDGEGRPRKWDPAADQPESDEAVRTALDARQAVEAFFVYFSERCPKGGGHEYSGNVCSKCGIEADLMFRPHDPAAREYYKKYRDVFGAAMIAPRTAASPNLTSKIDETSAIGSTAPAPDRVISMSGAFAAAARLAGVSRETFTALGAGERRTIAEVAAGDNFEEPVGRGDGRIVAADAALREFLVAYSLLRNVAELPRQPPELIRAIGGIPQAEWAAFPGRFPLVLGGVDLRGYAAGFEAARWRLAPPEARLYPLGVLATAAAAVAELPGGKPFARMALGRILWGYSLLMQPAITLVNKPPPTYEVDEDFGAGEEDADPVAVEDPYSYEEIDYNGENDEPS